MSRQVDQSLPSLIATKYRPIRELGRGGMGAVYLVEHTHTGERFALKLLLGNLGANPQAVERFKMEARASARIGSENVVRMIDAGVAPELGDALYLVMELLEGQDLDKLVMTRGALSPAEVVPMLVQAARALDKAHAAGVVHRDLKPENLFLHRREDGTTVVKILDFGISKFLEDGPDGQRSVGLTKTGAMLGTPLYMSTEQIQGQPVSARTDVWAIGLIAYFLLAGSSYWKTAHQSTGSVMTLVAEITVNELEAPSRRASSLQLTPTWPPAFDAWFLQCVHRDPAARFGSVGEAVAALATALGTPELGAPSTAHAPGGVFDATVLGSQPAAGSSTGLAMAHTHGALRSSGTAERPKARAVPFVLGAGAVCVLGAAAFYLSRDGSSAGAAAPGQVTADRTSQSAMSPPTTSQPDVTPVPSGSAQPSAASPPPLRPAAPPSGKRATTSPPPQPVVAPPKAAAPPDAYGAR